MERVRRRRIEGPSPEKSGHSVASRHPRHVIRSKLAEERDLGCVGVRLKGVGQGRVITDSSVHPCYSPSLFSSHYSSDRHVVMAMATAKTRQILSKRSRSDVWCWRRRNLAQRHNHATTLYPNCHNTLTLLFLSDGLV